MNLNLLLAINFCKKTGGVWKLVGYVLMILKIAIPIILIILGTIDIAKAVIASKDDEITKATTKFFKRIVAAVVIFFIPTIVGLIFDLITVGWTKEVKDDYAICKTCVVTPGKCSIDDEGRATIIETTEEKTDDSKKN